MFMGMPKNLINSGVNERKEISEKELEILCGLVEKLTRIKVDQAPHACIANFSSEILSKVVFAYRQGVDYELDDKLPSESWVIGVIEEIYGSGKAMQVADILKEG